MSDIVLEHLTSLAPLGMPALSWRLFVICAQLLSDVESLGEERPLHKAAADADAETVRALLLGGEVAGWRSWLQQPSPANVDERDGDGRTALHIAAESLAGERSRAVVDILLSNGAEANTVDNAGCTPLLLAAAAGDARICERLLASGADPNAATTSATDKFDLLETPLVSAAWAGHENVVELILLGGAQINQRTAVGNTALHEAVEARQKGVVRQLVAHGADTNARGSDRGATPLHMAVWEFDETDEEDATAVTAIAATLIEHGADVSVEDESGYSAVHHATEDGKPTMLKLLLAAVANNGHNNVKSDVAGSGHVLPLAQIRTRGGLPPLHLALHGGKSGTASAVRTAKACADVLLGAGADLEDVDGHGSTALHWTAHESEEELTR